MLAFVHEMISFSRSCCYSSRSKLTCNLCITSMAGLSGFVFIMLIELIVKMLQDMLFSYRLSFNEIGRIYIFFIGLSNQRMHTPSVEGDVKQCLTKII